jgi:ABC-type polysaccharide/polyol phosphate transport system ATPase subunit
VSHDFKAVQDLCTRAIWLENGIICADGKAAEVLEKMRERYHWDGKQRLETERESAIQLKEFIV